MSLASGGGGASCSRFTEDVDVAAAERARKKAEAGNRDAQFEFAEMCEDGIGVPQSDIEAAKWYRAAAEAGLPEAQYEMGVICEEGAGVEQDFLEAVKWYRMAASGGEVDAQFALGVLFYREDAMGQDLIEALKWFRIAAEHDDANAVYSVGLMYSLGEGVGQSDEEAMKWFLRAAELGHTGAQYAIGTMYGMGEGVEQNLGEAIRWYRAAADADEPNPDAQNDVAWIYSTSSQPEYRDPRKGVRYALEAVRADPEDWAYQHTLAAAYASNGWFEEAIAAGESAIELLKLDPELADAEEDRKTLLQDMEGHLTLFKNGEAYVDIEVEEEVAQ